MLPQTEALLLEDVLLDARDGLVRCKQQLWYHFQRFPWNLENPEEKCEIPPFFWSVVSLAHGTLSRCQLPG